MASQLDLFSSPPALPEGFRYTPEVITASDEQALLEDLRRLPFTEFDFHGYVGKRRTVSFGASYDFATERVRSAAEMPAFLRGLRAVAAAFAGLPAESLQQALVTEYGRGAGIGWHRDKGVFDRIVGISLVSTCRFRLRRRRAAGWERFAVDASPRSAYLLSGPARTEWEHSVPAVEQLRYSVTFRSLRAVVA